MIALDRAASSLAVLLADDEAGFRHLSTAWCVGPGEWISALAEETMPSRAVLLSAVAGDQALPVDWEWSGGVVGFRCDLAAEPLSAGGELHKRQGLRAVGYPSVIDHPAFSLSAGSLDVDRYLPYLCPWSLDGHLALYSVDDGWLTGRFYPGLNGSPVFADDDRVVGMVIDGPYSPDHPSLTRFRRIG